MLRFLEDPQRLLARHDDPPNAWLYCDECRRFFQHKSMNDDRCPLAPCVGIGLGFNIFWWDAMREPDDERWPKHPGELSHGMQVPDMEVFYRAQFEARVDSVLGRFAQSRPFAELDEPPRYLRAFLKMMSDLESDLTTPSECPFYPDDVIDILDQLPVWSHTADPNEIPRMLRELRSFFEFARTTDTIRDADGWLEVLTSKEGLAEALANTMRTDRRLAKNRAAGTGAAQQPRAGTAATRTSCSRPRRKARRRRRSSKRKRR